MTIDNLLTTLQQTGNAIFGAFSWPGEYAVMQLAHLAPGLAAYLSAPDNHVTALVILSLVYWYLVVVLATIIVKTCRNITRVVTATGRSILFRITLEIGSAKTRLVCKLRERLRWSKPRQDNETPMVEFDKLDLAILRCAVVTGPGFAMSAPELAERFRLRPAQVQRSLDKLCSNAMITTVIGSTNGFDNYHLTDSGNAFIAMWGRQHPRTSEASGASPAWAPVAGGQATSRSASG